MVKNLHEIDLFKVALNDQQATTAHKAESKAFDHKANTTPLPTRPAANTRLKTVASEPTVEQSNYNAKGLNNKQFALIVCSHQPAIDKLEDYCNHLNVETYVAKDGLQALKWLRIQKPNLLIIGSILPKMNAAQLITLIRRNNSLQQIPIILLNQDNDLFISAIAKSLGIESCLNSPIKQSTIAKQIKRYCTPVDINKKPMLGIISDTPNHRLILRQRLISYGYDICFNGDPSQLEGLMENLDKIVDGWIMDVSGEQWLSHIDCFLDCLNSPILYGLEKPPIYPKLQEQLKDPKYLKWEKKLINKIKETIKQTT